jgi:hypothetical protein
MGLSCKLLRLFCQEAICSLSCSLVSKLAWQSPSRMESFICHIPPGAMCRGKDELYPVHIGFCLLLLIDFIEGAGKMGTQIIFYQGHIAAILALVIQQICHYFHPSLRRMILLYAHIACLPAAQKPYRVRLLLCG